MRVMLTHGKRDPLPQEPRLQQLQIQAVDATLGGFVSTQVSLAGNPLVRFTGSTTSFTPIYNH
jgi:hypothetical protein